MSPDLSQERLKAWGTLGGVVVVLVLVVSAVWYGVDVPGTIEKRDKERKRIAAQGGQPIAERLQVQSHANEALRKVINRLMDQTRFEVATDYQVLSDSSLRIEIEPGYRWKDRFLDVRQRIRDAAKPGSIESGEYLGFPNAIDVPPAPQVPGMLAMLQLVEKISTAICTSGSPWMERFDLKPGVPVEGGPVIDGKALLREYPITLTVRGELTAIMRLLWRFAQILPVPDRVARPYPMVIKGFSITGENATAVGGINQLNATIELSAMEYMRSPGAGLTQGTDQVPRVSTSSSGGGARP